MYILPLSHTLHTFYPQDRTIAVWDMKSPKDIVLRRVLVGHRAAVNVVDFDEKYIVSASGDRTIKVGLTVVLFPGMEDGEEKERLVHTVCACTPKNLWRLCLYMYTGDIKTCRIDVPVDILFEYCTVLCLLVAGYPKIMSVFTKETLYLFAVIPISVSRFLPLPTRHFYLDLITHS